MRLNILAAPQTKGKLIRQAARATIVIVIVSLIFIIVIRIRRRRRLLRPDVLTVIAYHNQ